MQQSQNKRQQSESDGLHTVTKDHWSWAKRLKAQMKHIQFEQGDDIFISDWELNRPSVQVSHKKQMFTPPILRSTLVCMSLINANIQDIQFWLKLPESLSRKTFHHSNTSKKTTS